MLKKIVHQRSKQQIKACNDSKYDWILPSIFSECLFWPKKIPLVETKMDLLCSNLWMTGICCDVRSYGNRFNRASRQESYKILFLCNQSFEMRFSFPGCRTTMHWSAKMIACFLNKILGGVFGTILSLNFLLSVFRAETKEIGPSIKQMPKLYWTWFCCNINKFCGGTYYAIPCSCNNPVHNIPK